jgi:hypothetical protein
MDLTLIAKNPDLQKVGSLDLTGKFDYKTAAYSVESAVPAMPHLSLACEPSTLVLPALPHPSLGGPCLTFASPSSHLHPPAVQHHGW